ncbi:NFATC2-interacting protein isoform X3 [Lissotriton helveticus]
MAHPRGDQYLRTGSKCPVRNSSSNGHQFTTGNPPLTRSRGLLSTPVVRGPRGVSGTHSAGGGGGTVWEPHSAWPRSPFHTPVNQTWSRSRGLLNTPAFPQWYWPRVCLGTPINIPRNWPGGPIGMQAIQELKAHNAPVAAEHCWNHSNKPRGQWKGRVTDQSVLVGPRSSTKNTGSQIVTRSSVPTTSKQMTRSKGPIEGCEVNVHTKSKPCQPSDLPHVERRFRGLIQRSPPQSTSASVLGSSAHTTISCPARDTLTETSASHLASNTTGQAVPVTRVRSTTPNSPASTAVAIPSQPALSGTGEDRLVPQVPSTAVGGTPTEPTLNGSAMNLNTPAVSSPARSAPMQTDLGRTERMTLSEPASGIPSTNTPIHADTNSTAIQADTNSTAIGTPAQAVRHFTTGAQMKPVPSGPVKIRQWPLAPWMPVIQKPPELHCCTLGAMMEQNCSNSSEMVPQQPHPAGTGKSRSVQLSASSSASSMLTQNARSGPTSTTPTQTFSSSLASCTYMQAAPSSTTIQRPTLPSTPSDSAHMQTDPRSPDSSTPRLQISDSPAGGTPLQTTTRSRPASTTPIQIALKSSSSFIEPENSSSSTTASMQTQITPCSSVCSTAVQPSFHISANNSTMEKAPYRPVSTTPIQRTSNSHSGASPLQKAPSSMTNSIQTTTASGLVCTGEPLAVQLESPARNTINTVDLSSFAVSKSTQTVIGILSASSPVQPSRPVKVRPMQLAPWMPVRCQSLPVQTCAPALKQNSNNCTISPLTKEDPRRLAVPIQSDPKGSRTTKSIQSTEDMTCMSTTLQSVLTVGNQPIQSSCRRSNKNASTQRACPLKRRRLGQQALHGRLTPSQLVLCGHGNNAPSKQTTGIPAESVPPEDTQSMSVMGTLIQLSITTPSKDTGNDLCDQRPCIEKDSKELVHNMTSSSALDCSVTSGLYQEIPSDESSDETCSKAFPETEPGPCINCAQAGSSDSDVEIIRTKMPSGPRVKRRRILNPSEITTVPIYSNKVNSSLKLDPGDITALAKLKEPSEDVENDGFGSLPNIQSHQCSKSLPLYELTDSEDETLEMSSAENKRNKSPSPPPASLSPKRRRGRAYKKISEVNAKLKDLDMLRSPTSQALPNDSDDEVILVDSSITQEITLKVRRHSKLYRVSMQMSDSLHTVVDQMASTLKVNSSQILLMLRDEELRPSDTPRTLNLTIADIIDCVVLSQTMEQNPDGNDNITLRIQGQEKQSHFSVTLRRTEPLKVLMEKYKQAKGLQGRKVSFLFEGQKLTARSTPEQLGMEPDDVIELWI